MKFWLTLLIFSISIFAKERITDYQVQINILENGLLDITEDIEVEALGDKIKRGIYRQIPLTRMHPQKGMISYDIIAKEVKKNDHPEPYHLQESGQILKIFIGNKNTFLPRGKYRYQIKYIATNQIFNLHGFDELYWNAIGQYWEFPIDIAKVYILHPAHLQVNEIDAWTGKLNKKDKNFKMIKTDNLIEFEITQSFQAKEGMTFSLKFPSNTFKPLSWFEILKIKIKSMNDYAKYLKSIVLIFFYYLIVWFLYGKDPNFDHVSPKDHPPGSLTPGKLRFIYNMGYDLEVFTSLILNLIIREKIKLENPESTSPKLILNPNAITNELSLEEKIILKNLFEEKQYLTIDRSNAAHFMKASRELNKFLSDKTKRQFFKTNWQLMMLPIFYIFYLCFDFYIKQQNEIILVAAIVFCFSTFINTFINSRFFTKLKSKKVYVALIISIFLVFHNGIFFYGLSQSGVPALLIFCMVMTVILTFIFWELMKVPSAKGLKTYRDIAAFENYLKVQSPKKVSTLAKNNPFEHYYTMLPYAFALGLLDDWTEKFHKDIEEASKVSSLNNLAHSRHYNQQFLTLGPDINQICQNINSCLQTSGGSGSSSSGGSSGGGGGGGGGGGW